MIVTAFPSPPAIVQVCLDQLDELMTTDPDSVADLPYTSADVPRPWDPAGCHPEVRQDLWQWLDDVAAWINRTYCSRTADMIPACWPQHPYIAVELAGVACARVKAFAGFTVDGAEEWHRYTLPSFLDRVSARSGIVCKGKHGEWPGAATYHQFGSAAALEARQQFFLADVEEAP